MNELNQNYYATIPVSVLCDPNLTDREMRVLMVIVNLTHRYGYCCAENEYLSQVSCKEKRTVPRILSSLEEKGYIRREVIRDDKSRTVVERRIYVTFMPSLEPENQGEEQEKGTAPHGENDMTPHGEIATTPHGEIAMVNKENNIYIHTSEQNQASQPACSSGRCPVSEQSSDAYASQIKSEAPEPGPQTQPEKKPKRERPHYERESDEYRLAAYLYNWKLQFNPNMKQPDLQQWAHQFHNLLHSKRRAKPVTVEEIKWRIEFSQKNGFWRKNIQSAAKLCEQYDRLYDEMSNLEQQGNLRIDDRKNVVMLRDKHKGDWK